MKLNKIELLLGSLLSMTGCSGGSNASPEGNGLSRICAYMQELAKDGTLVENSNSLSKE